MVTDLDGTLVHADLLWEGLLRVMRRRPWRIGALLLALLTGRTIFKTRVAREAGIDPESLPWNNTVVDFLAAEHKRGRPVWLATAAERSVAEAVAGHLGIIDRIFATTEGDNVKGARKRDLLLEAAPDGFDYIGDGDADIPVFNAAREAWTVGPAAERLARRAGATGTVKPLRDALPSMSVSAAVVRLLRVHQWLKNTLVFVPLIAGHRWLDTGMVISTVAVFAAFCLIASAAYVLNDLVDLEHDRAHPRKRYRSIASGAVSLRLAICLFPLLLIGGGGIGLALPLGTLGVLAGYFVITTLYSIAFKRIVLLDILILAVLYNVRILAGGMATGIALSYWLIGFALFLFFSLAVMKRVTEVRELGGAEDGRGTGRGYRAGDDQLLLPLGIACSVSAAVVFGLYTTGADMHEAYSRPAALLLMVPLILIWQCNLWLATIRGRMHDDPLIYAVRDPVTWIVVTLSVGLFAAAL